MLEFACPHCQSRVTARPEQAGQRFECPKCGKRFKVPGASTSSASTPDDFFDWDEEARPAPVNASRSSANADTTAAASPISADEPLDASELLLPDEPELADGAAAANADEWAGEEGLALDLDAPASTPDDDPFGVDLSELERAGEAIGQAKPMPRSTSNSPAGRATNGSSDDVASLDEASASEAKPLVENVQFGISCKVCDARIVVHMADVGKTIRCPDCYSDVEVMAPKTIPKPKQTPKSDYASFKLSGSDEPRPDAQLPKRVVDDMLARAEKELDEAGEERKADYFDDVPQLVPWFRHVCGFLIDPRVIVRIALLGCAMWILVSMTTAAWRNYDGQNMMSMFMLAAACVASCVVGVPATVLWAVSGLAVLQDTANERDRVESWPDLNFLDWVSDSLYFVSSFVIAGLPGWLVYMVAMFAGVSTNIGLFAIVLSEFVLFPFILLSELDANSPWVPYSRVVIDSVQKFQEPWGAFLFPSALMAFAAFILLAMMSVFGFITHGIGSFLIVTMAFVYFRLLGRLATQISTIDIIKEPPATDAE